VLGLITLAATIGLADSVNPSTVAPALYLATSRDGARRVAALTLGVFAVNFLGGVFLTLGPGQAILAVVPRPTRHTTHLVEVFVGSALALVAAGLWFGRGRITRRVAGEKKRIRSSSVLVGATVTAAELPTAFPYFAVIAAVIGSGRNVPTKIALLAIFNAAFVAPLLLISLIRSRAGERGAALLARIRIQLDRHAALIIPTLLFAIACVIALIGTIGLVGGLS
jgi:cytochrome c biogenesis protein CcdA